MDTEVLKMRVYFLAGQLEEAKKVFTDAMGEISAANKKQAEPSTNTETAAGAKVVCSGDESVTR